MNLTLKTTSQRAGRFVPVASGPGDFSQHRQRGKIWVYGEYLDVLNEGTA